MAALRSLRRAGVAPVAAAVSISVAFLLVAGGASGAGKARSAARISGRPGDSHAAQHVKGRLGASLASKGKSYVYAEDGTNPDGIDVYSVSGTTLTNIQHVSNVGKQGNSYYYGTHHLAVVRTPADCLVFASAGAGTVYSFTINAKTGMLSSSPVSSATVGGYPGDLAVSGSTVFESNSNGNNPSRTIDVLSVGAHCSLARVTQNSTGTEEDIDIALANATTVVSTDTGSGDMVAYKLKKSGKLVEAVKTPGQLQSPQSVATMITKKGVDVFTGGDLSPAQAQGFSFSGAAFKALKGSPQTATSSTSPGPDVAVSAANHLLAQGVEFNGTIGWYNLAKGISYTSSTPLAITTDFPSALTVLGNNLLVPQILGGDLESCTLAPNSVSGCHTVATLTGGSSDFGSTVATLTVVKKKKK